VESEDGEGCGEEEGEEEGGGEPVYGGFGDGEVGGGCCGYWGEGEPLGVLVSFDTFNASGVIHVLMNMAGILRRAAKTGPEMAPLMLSSG